MDERGQPPKPRVGPSKSVAGTKAVQAEDLLEAATFLGRHFACGGDEAWRPDRDLPDGGLRDWLTRRVGALLEGDVQRLTQILYRIDVSERRVERAFEAASLGEVADQIAGLLLDRLLRALARRRTLAGLPDDRPSTDEGTER